MRISKQINAQFFTHSSPCKGVASNGLVHARLVDGLMAQGMPAAFYAHDVPFAVMELMGFNEEEQHRNFPRYRLWQEQARLIDISKGNAQMRSLAERIYEMLEKLSNSRASADRPHAPTLRSEWASGCAADLF